MASSAPARSSARSKKLTPEDVQGGTFSITNIGSLGGLFSFPIINVPEAAILGVHTIYFWADPATAAALKVLVKAQAVVRLA